MIEPAPTSWRELQQRVAAILTECGLTVEVEKDIRTTRETVNIDVYAEDAAQNPKLTYICECKHWQRAVPKTVVHAIRSVVTDHGANWGIIISSGGFQSGAYEAAAHTNLQLVDWTGFQAIFEERWWRDYVVPRIEAEVDPLVEYTEPINSRIFRKADAMDEQSQRRFVELREQHREFAFFGLHFYALPKFRPDLLPRGSVPPLPVPAEDVAKLHKLAPNLPLNILQATTLRQLFDRIGAHAREALAEFDGLFGGRA